MGTTLCLSKFVFSLLGTKEHVVPGEYFIGIMTDFHAPVLFVAVLFRL